ncbi:hypothetical protein RQP46_005656 [Phenoliferia psychrophenolica]
MARVTLRSPLPYVGVALLLLIVWTTRSTTSLSSFSPASSKSTLDTTLLTTSDDSLSSSDASKWSSYPHDPTNALSYRNHLELTTSPASQITHSPTLGFSHIYVLSLPHRTDRREDMRKLARALGLEISFIDAAKKEEPFFQWIAERVAEVRIKRRALMAAARKVKPEKLGGLAVGSVWATPFQDPHTREPFPLLPDARYPSGNWTSHLELAHSTGTLSSLVPSTPDLNITDVLWDKREWLPTRQVNDGVMSTYWGHTRVLKHIVEAGDESALVLEDDVDLEWDLERLWARIARKLPKDWETVHLGHCWGHEQLQPQYLHPLLHKATAPKCLHGWAVSSRGASHLLSLLNSPWSAYATAVDVAVPSFIHDRLLRAFSVEPPLIIQRKDGPSDLQGGNGSKWRGLLRDSTWDRIWKDEGHEIVEEEWDSKHLDPATTFREAKAANC